MAGILRSARAPARDSDALPISATAGPEPGRRRAGAAGCTTGWGCRSPSLLHRANSPSLDSPCTGRSITYCYVSGPAVCTHRVCPRRNWEFRASLLHSPPTRQHPTPIRPTASAHVPKRSRTLDLRTTTEIVRSWQHAQRRELPPGRDREQQAVPVGSCAITTGTPQRSDRSGLRCQTARRPWPELPQTQPGSERQKR